MKSVAILWTFTLFANFHVHGMLKWALENGSGGRDYIPSLDDDDTSESGGVAHLSNCEQRIGDPDSGGADERTCSRCYILPDTGADSIAFLSEDVIGISARVICDTKFIVATRPDNVCELTWHRIKECHKKRLTKEEIKKIADAPDEYPTLATSQDIRKTLEDLNEPLIPSCDDGAELRYKRPDSMRIKSWEFIQNCVMNAAVKCPVCVGIRISKFPKGNLKGGSLRDFEIK